MRRYTDEQIKRLERALPEYNPRMANKGMAFEAEVIAANEQYEKRGLALVQKINTGWTPHRKGENIVGAHVTKKSTLDFRGTVTRDGTLPGLSISFDCKESSEAKGLPLSYISENQIEYMRKALRVGEITFILCYIKPLDKRYYISVYAVLSLWELWQENKGKRGFNFIPVESMKEVKSRDGIVLDYLAALEWCNMEICPH